jgi:Domain of Unknown Function with PDB structure (DUF3857)/Transglutaminase-like superfamily
MTPASYRQLKRIVFVCLICAQCRGQELDPTTLQDSLKNGASVVRRVDDTQIDIESPGKARMRYKRVVTVLNNFGDSYASIYAFYDKFHHLNSATGLLYDANGKLLKKIRKNDMEDQNIDGAGLLLTDTRIKFYHFVCRSYPYTVVYEEDTELNGLFLLPSWIPQPSPAVAVENSRLIIKIPEGCPLNYRQYHYPGQPGISEGENGSKTFLWEYKNQRALPTEPFQPSWYNMEARVALSPGKFEIEGYKGNLNSWDDLGRFIGTLFEGRDQLPEEARKKVHALVDGVGDDHEKIKLLYEFLQKNTHYVGIELGLGGWQPFDAAYVYNKRYGDCKALSNFMVALLKEAGIRACDVLVRGGYTDQPIDTGFASGMFNHMIVLAFAGKDSVWLECTSSILPPGYLGGFTADRYALMIDGTGGWILHTPVYGIADNRLTRTVIGSIDSSGLLQADLHIIYAGLQQDALETDLEQLSKKEMLQRRQQSFEFQNCNISKLDYREFRTPIPSIEESMQISADHYAGLSGKRLFISTGSFIKKVSSLKEDGGSRKNDFELTSSVEEMDSVILQIPSGYILEGTLPSRNYVSSFGSYKIRAELIGDTLALICHFSQRKGLYPASLYPKLVRFLNLIHREATIEMVFVKKS